MRKALSTLLMLAPGILLAQNINYTLKGSISSLNKPAKVCLSYRTAASVASAPSK